MSSRDFSHDLLRHLRNGEDIDSSLSKIRTEGATIIDSIKAIRTVRGCDLREAKQLAHDSRAWADLKEQHARLHEDLDRLAQELDREDEQ